ncbi:Benzoyl-CoA reductase/2-hydroxyglutaryl-CoA dehydratase subunit, BcrC/BadD/HgdB [Desulfitobacterium dichloroeliminans LMG P-21439]|uniref:Benzoyl-CoA reductase/2-hydroxyglutaryl-CoA dehydratase subunit, BcrC/BadD/HgdB n=1 Tax=Desulfitobacterium dichloroeliminans (strain LMG P-21439 / DCA1) TaxID=871963 RepID=L0F5D2_DESDL|nr:2-hydroxyacyl-CoA dehydratase family protein [Desulfitobacterium dichloroeliminans]AGA68250.1 Benzoyl-CoA reductase/2-hydroxyglutaryl-CoA dehydratase subunit, BcrC/BadD/HgdB [Desulfitobacterium dichloroeliminans LMG P-21439]
MSKENTLVDGIGINNPYIEAWKQEGKKVIGTICCYVPEEILHAAGLLPIRVRATGCTDNSNAEAWMSPFSCSYARSCLEFLMNGTYDYLDGLVATDGCLMAGRIYDNWKYAGKEKMSGKDYFLRMIGAPRLIKDITLPFYIEELTELKKGIEEFTGTVITDEKLQESIALYNETRRLIRELYDLRKSDNPVISGREALNITLAAMSMPKEDYNPMLKDFLAEAGKREPLKESRARLMIIGSALDDPEYLKVIEDKGGLIVADTTCYGSRYLWEPVEMDGDALTSLAKAYLSRPTCPRMCNLHNEIHDFMLQMAKDFRIDGIVYTRMKYCEIWGGENVFFEEKIKEANIPLLTVEREEILTNAGQLAVRAEAFIEMIEGGKM